MTLVAQSGIMICSFQMLKQSGRLRNIIYIIERKSSKGDLLQIPRSESEDFCTTISATDSVLERFLAAFLRVFLRVAFRPIAGPPFSAKTQRKVAAGLSLLMTGVTDVVRRKHNAGVVPTEVVTPKHDIKATGAILYLHGGTFLIGNPGTHRAITTRLALAAGRPVWVPDFRLAPEHPYPKSLEDALVCWQEMLACGIQAREIVVAGDATGGALALALAIRLRDLGHALPAGLALISPFADPSLTGSSLLSKARIDPMVRRAWIEQGLAAYTCPHAAFEHRPLETSLTGLPPILIQVGDQEILLSDSTRLAEHARTCGVSCQLEMHTDRWHVFHLEAVFLSSARNALRTIGTFVDKTLRDNQSSEAIPGPG